MTTPFLWTKPVCFQCTQTKRRFDERGIQFDTEDITNVEYADALEAFKAEGLLSAPIVDLGEFEVWDEHQKKHVSSWSGYRPDLIDQIPVDEAVAA